MSASLEVRMNLRAGEVRALLSRMSQPKAGRALSVAVNTTARQVRTMAAREVAKGMGVRRKDVDSAFVIRPFSQPDTLHAIVRGVGAPLPLHRFKPRQTKKGVTANAWGQRRLYPGAFIAEMKSGHVGVFIRKTRKRFPIKELWGSGVAQVMAQDAVSSTIERHAGERLRANVMRQLDRYTRSRN